MEKHSDNLKSLNKVIETLDETQAQSICECKELLQNVDLTYAVSFVTSNFPVMSNAIKTLETRGVPIESIDGVEECLKQLYDKTYSVKLSNVLAKNQGYSTILKINSILSAWDAKRC